MRNDNQRWDEPSKDAVVFIDDTAQIHQIWPDRQTLISAENVRDKTDLPLVDWPGNLPNTSYAVVLRRDRILEVNGPLRNDGWDTEQNMAVSGVTFGYSVFEIAGTGALELLKHGGFVDTETPSGSTARMLFGLNVLLYRRADETYVIHISSPLGEALRATFLFHLAGRM